MIRAPSATGLRHERWGLTDCMIGNAGGLRLMDLEEIVNVRRERLVLTAPLSTTKPVETPAMTSTT